MNETEPTNQESAKKFEAGETHAQQATEELRSAAQSKASELRSVGEAKAKEYRTKIENTYEQTRNRAHSLQEEGEAYVREQPLRGVLAALGVGFVIGLLFRR